MERSPAIELWHGGFHANNRLTREPMLSPSGQRGALHPAGECARHGQGRHRGVPRLAARGGGAGEARRLRHRLCLCRARLSAVPVPVAAHQPAQRRIWRPLDNRTRLLRGDDRGYARTRSATLRGRGAHGGRRTAWRRRHHRDGEGREIVALLAELPDLWDVNVAGALGNDSKSARFSDEGFQERYVAFVKKLTTKPVVERRPLHLARPRWCRQISAASSISSARRGRRSPIRSCRGRSPKAARTKSANASAAISAAPPTTRACRSAARRTRPWARNGGAAGIPSASRPRRSKRRVLVVGGGPAGLECALALGRRGYEVTLAEAIARARRPGAARSRAAGPCHLDRVRDYRQHMIGKLANVAIYRESPHDAPTMSAASAPIMSSSRPAAAGGATASARSAKTPLESAGDAVDPDAR